MPSCRQPLPEPRPKLRVVGGPAEGDTLLQAVIAKAFLTGEEVVVSDARPVFDPPAVKTRTARAWWPKILRRS